MAKILPIPDIPEELVLSARAGKLVPFIGAGVSVLAGSPNWHDFADATIRFFANEGKINLGHLEQIKNVSPRVKLSFAKSLEKEHGIRIDFRKILHPEKNPHEQRGQEIYGYLSKLSKTFVTTNYDNWLDREHPVPGFELKAEAKGDESGTSKKRRVLYKVDDFSYDNLTENTVIHLHGSLEDPDPNAMILTMADYIRHYSNDRGKKENVVLTFLKNLFSEKSVLFIGYSLEELEILEYVIQKAGVGQGKETKHFILQGYFTHEQVLADTMERYYLRECGVHLLPFSRDGNDWEQLKEVIKAFATDIPINSPLMVQQFQEMEALLNVES